MDKVFLGIDNGGTLCKAVLFDEGATRLLRLHESLG